MERKIYEVIDPGAVFCAGKRVPESRHLELTEAEARYELLGGNIRPGVVEAEPPVVARRARSADQPAAEG